MEINIYLLAVLATVVTLVWFLQSYYIGDHFSKYGIQVLPSWPIFGHLLSVILQKEHFKDMLNRHYLSFPDQKYIGFKMFSKPMVILTDLEMIKQITIKDFDHFSDHLLTIDESMDPLFGNNLFSLQGKKWRDMRSTLSPVFTSSKMRNVFQLVADCAEYMAQFYLKEFEKPINKELGHMEVEMKDAFSRYTNDVIASAAFGIELNSHAERDNHFYNMGKESSSITGFKLIKIFFISLSPKIFNFFGIKVFRTQLTDYFRNLVLNNIKTRENGKIFRPDMIQLLMEAKRGSLMYDPELNSKEAGFATVNESTIGKQHIKRQWTDDDIAAQAMLFFIAGFDSASSFLIFVLYELATQPDIQKRLQEEMDKVAANNNGSINYNDLHSMKYLDMVVSETLRLSPPATAIDRKCIKPYVFPPPCDNPLQKGYQMNVGEGVSIPVWSIHHDAKYYPDPEKFDPERFSDDNKGNIQPFTYLPFGVGPRNCIGSRFALMEVKAILFHLLVKFDFVVISKTKIPMELSKNNFNLGSKNGFWVGLKPRIQ